jgi:hypothetical protein
MLTKLNHSEDVTFPLSFSINAALFRLLFFSSFLIFSFVEQNRTETVLPDKNHDKSEIYNR